MVGDSLAAAVGDSLATFVGEVLGCTEVLGATLGVPVGLTLNDGALLGDGLG